MKKSDTCLVSAIAAVLTLGAAVSAAAESTGPQTEMCFNYRLENSCGANGSGCGGSALGRIACGAHPDRYQSPGRWMIVPHGTCEQIYGGSLKPPESSRN
ncbi:MAG: hypothetical protein HY082_06335 [Gammaproteobacteria bacterium]|nr:hypothetical protein [Gammaproteobacteria bacterium]